MACQEKVVDQMTPAQCRAARGLLEIMQSQLAHAADRGLSTVDFEKGRRESFRGQLSKYSSRFGASRNRIHRRNGWEKGLRLTKSVACKAK